MSFRDTVQKANRWFSRENLPNSILGRAMLRFASDTDEMISVEDLMKHVFQRDASSVAEGQIDKFAEAVGIPAEDFKNYILYNGAQQVKLMSSIREDAPDHLVESHIMATMMAPIPAHLLVGMYVQQELDQPAEGYVRVDLPAKELQLLRERWERGAEDVEVVAAVGDVFDGRDGVLHRLLGVLP